MIESVATKIASHIKKNVPGHPASFAVLKFSLEGLLNTFGITVLTLLLSLFWNKTYEVLVVMISFAVLRQMTGGFHLATGEKCIMVSTLLLTVLSFIHLSNPLIPIFTASSMLLIFWYAPAGIEKQSRIPAKYYPHLKAIALLLVSLNFIFKSPEIAIAFFAQSLTLIHERG